MTEQQIVTYVRSFTTPNTTEIPDEQILYFAGRGDGSYTENVYDGGEIDFAGVIADSWEYIGRGILYMSESHGPVSGNQPLPVLRAASWRSRSRKSGVALTAGSVIRKDVTGSPAVLDGDNEFGVGD